MDKRTRHKYRALNLGNLSHPLVFSTQTGVAATWNRLPLTSLSNDINFQLTKSRAVHLNHEACINDREISLSTVQQELFAPMERVILARLQPNIFQQPVF